MSDGSPRRDGGWFDLQVFDFRLYDHGTTGPLTPAHIRTLAQDAVAKATLGGEANTCLTIDNLRMQEKEWADKFGYARCAFAKRCPVLTELDRFPDTRVRGMLRTSRRFQVLVPPSGKAPEDTQC